MKAETVTIFRQNECDGTDSFFGNNIGVDPSEIYECIALLRGHFGWLNPLTKVF